VQERANDFLFVEVVLFRELERIDVRQMMVLAVADQRFDGGDRIGIGRLA
jgi:hypothetical protein